MNVGRVLCAAISLLLVATPSVVHCADHTASREYPLWDGKESVEEYARRAGLEPVLNLELDGGAGIPLVLVPAGEFYFGIRAPEPPRTPLWRGQAIASPFLFVLVCLFAFVVVRWIRRGRLQFSLFLFMLVVLASAGGMYGYFEHLRTARLWERHRLVSKVYEMAPEETREAGSVRVQLRRPIYLGRFEVTNGEYGRALGKPVPVADAKLPVTQATCNQALAFCETMTKRTGRKVRLPTEAEWVFACRGGIEPKPGDIDIEYLEYLLEGVVEIAYDTQSVVSVGETHVGGFGLHGISGNAWEWCGDIFEEGKDPQQPDNVSPAPSGAHAYRRDVWTFERPHERRGDYKSFFIWGGPKIDMHTGQKAGFRIACEP